ncbi:hypothetical protein C162_03107 [Paenibacillus sp. FSL R7-269]|nr:hypothetical protein C162_03107 [Paenibacillus sp. FSL R7-269]
MVNFITNFSISILATLFICFIQSLIAFMLLPLLSNWKSLFITSIKKFSILYLLSSLTIIYSLKTFIISFLLIFFIFLYRIVIKKKKLKNNYTDVEIKNIVEDWLSKESTMQVKYYSTTVTNKNKVNIRLDIDSMINYSELDLLRNVLPLGSNIKINNLKKNNKTKTSFQVDPT